MNLFFIVVLGLLMHATRSFSSGAFATGSAGISLALGYVLLSAFFAGRIFKGMHLPKLTGYLATGILVGPALLGFVSEPMIERLAIVNGMAIALIALTAGSELDIATMRPIAKTVGWVSLVGVVGTAAVLTVTVFLCRSWLPFMDGMTFAEGAAVSLVLGVVMTAQSPAVTIALRDETEADGPIVKTVLGVVILADLVVILLFAIASSVAKGMLGGTADVRSTVMSLAWELPGSLLVGAAIGGVVAMYLRFVQESRELFVITAAFVIAEVGTRVHLDPLLIALSAGMLVRNATPHGDALHKSIETSSLPVYVVFFAVAGASIHLDVLSVVGIPALLFVTVRACGLLGGSRLGARIAGAPPSVQRWAGFGLLPQAGLALALSLLFARTFPEFGAEAGALTLGVVAINELVAPIVYRYALVRSGEAGARTRGASEDPATPQTA